MNDVALVGKMNDESDRLIENLTPAEKLCFMLLDQQRRLEDRFEEYIAKQEYNEKWMIYYVYTRTCWGPRFHNETQYERSLNLVLCKLPYERQMELLRACFGKHADKVESFFHKDNSKSTPEMEYRVIDYSAIRHVHPNWDDYVRVREELSFHNMSHRVWSLMTIHEARLYIDMFDVHRYKDNEGNTVQYQLVI